MLCDALPEKNLPNWMHYIQARLSPLGLAPTRHDEIAHEMSQHLDDRYAELIAGGAADQEALRQTLAEFASSEAFIRRMSMLRQAGKADPDRMAQQGDSAFSGFRLDLRYTLRGLRKDWGFTLAIVL